MSFDFIVVKIFSLTFISFALAMAWTPLLTHFLYKYKLGKQIRSSSEAPIFSALHQKKSGTPTMGGILVWMTVLVLSLIIFYLSLWFDSFFSFLNFLTRPQTLLPLGCLVSAALVGLLDDYLNVRKIGPYGGGLSVKHRLAVYTLIAMAAAFWFYFRLDWDLIRVPFMGNFNLGWWFIPLVIFVIVGTAFSVNEIDGLDGLAGGTLLIAYTAFGVIAFAQGKYDLAAFCGVIVGALTAFLWFNITPARFFMGDTGAMSLGVTLAVISILTKSVLLLPIIGCLFVIEALSVIIQVLSKKLRGKKVFLSAPIHHHFEAKGWPEAKVVMRFWVISGVFAIIGLVLFLLDKGAWH
ncbi:MAG: phospho-N-acetylmuramoyl-pentapeptide-transferase [Patescibacteria group bacterium]|jgi:phospho-N-acetylmuramoyl-pentapeptide-transferase